MSQNPHVQIIVKHTLTIRLFHSILTCRNRKIPGVTNNINNNSSVTVIHDSVTVSMHNTRKLELKQL